MAYSKMDIEPVPTPCKYNEKIEKVLQKFSNPNFLIKNEVYLNLFLTHLTNKNENGKNLVQNKDLNDIFTQWVIKVSVLWDNSQNKPSTTILSFTLNLASQLSGNEQVFVQLNSENVYESLVAVAEGNGDKDAIVVIGYITLLSSFLEHKSGLQWVLATNYWTEIVNYGLKAHTLYIRQKAYDFTIKLLQKTIKFNKNFCSTLIQNLIKPLKEAVSNVGFSLLNPNNEVVNKELYETLKPSLIFLSEVTESLVKHNNRDCLFLFVKLDTMETLNKVLLLSQDQEFSFLVIKNLTNIAFFQICIKLEGIKLNIHNIQDTKVFFDILESEIVKEHSRCVLKICHHGQVLWSYCGSRFLVYMRNGEAIEFPNQMLVLQLMPVLMISWQMLGNIDSTTFLLDDDYRREYIQKCVKLSAINTVRMCYKWKELLNINDLLELATFGFQLLANTKKYLNKEKAIILFQPLVYTLKDSLTYLELHPEAAIDTKLTQFLDSLIEIMIDVVKSFDITWKDSIETISVLKLACEVLSYTRLVNKLIVRGLRLLDMAISRYMSPDMVLLLENHKDSVVAQTGSLLYAKCHDSSWEIRDSALEVVYTISMNASGRFPSFKNILIEAGLPDLVLEMALKDGEFYVRATAMKCLQELIEISEMWELYIKKSNFLKDLLNIFENETEGIVRKEAATIIYRILKHHEFPEDVLPKLYDVMTHAASGDLHWEVKANALKFWYMMVEKLLTNQGMLDQKFPSVTFSKEHKKIVTLNDAEVRKRIIKVLNQLNNIGCLAVLKNAVEDDCDVVISESVTQFNIKFVELLKQYKVPCENIDICVSSDSSSTSSNSVPVTPNPQCSSDINSPFQFSESSSSTNIVSPTLSESETTPQISEPSQISSTSTSDSSSSIQNISKVMHLKESASIPNEEPLSAIEYEGTRLLNERSHRFDSLALDEMLDELLKSNDMTLLQNIYSPADQTINNTVKMKTKSHVLPSEFVKFMYNSVETHAKEKSAWLNSFDEFDSLLDDILKEYNTTTEINNMDCY